MDNYTNFEVDTGRFIAGQRCQLLHHDISGSRPIHNCLQRPGSGSGRNGEKINSGYAFQKIVIRPTLTIADEEARQHAADILRKVESLCLVSRALATAQEFDPKVEVSKLGQSFEVFTSERKTSTRDRKFVLQGGMSNEEL